MARKVDKPRVKIAAENADGAQDLQIMAPNQELAIAGRKLTVREYGFHEGLRLQHVAAPVVAALAAAAKSGDDDFDTIQGVLADHADAVIGMIALACNVDREWVDALNDQDGHVLLLTWWAVNGGFFVRRAQTRMAIELAKELKAKSASAGATSTPASPSTGSSATSTTSAAAPADS